MARQGRVEGAEIRFLCPAHDDHHPSARWNRAKAAWHCDACGAGGGALDLARCLEISLPEPEGLTLDRLVDAKRIPSDFLRSLGITEGVSGVERMKCVDIPYLNEQGEVLAIRKRLRLVGKPRFIWRRGDKPAPYGLWRLTEAREARRMIFVEGESDCWTLWHAGLPALGIPGASIWKEAWKRYLQGIDEVYVWREPDIGGDSLIPLIAAYLPDIKVIESPKDTKDPNELWLTVSCEIEAFQERMEQLMEAAQPVSQIRAEALSREAREFYVQAQELLEDPDLLKRVGDAIRASGYAGDLTPPLLVYISLTSRHLERPLNLAMIAQSSAGKNRAIDAALDLMPPEAYYLEKSGSARALIYVDADFAHKIVVVSEVDSIPEDGPPASAIRSLAADSIMSYDVVEKDPQTGQFATRRIEKPGPTGIITTSTRPLGEQMSTRLLTVTVPDTPEQTRAILMAHATAVKGTTRTTDVTAFVALQRWLDLAGTHEVIVPFADALAKAVPDKLVRMRRDFRQLLTVIQALALLYQRQRKRDEAGRVISEMDDYRMAWDLLLDTFTASASGGVSKTIRETAAAVSDLYDGLNPLTIKAVGEHLGLARDTTWHRVKRALALGHIVNLESRKGQPAKLVPGDPLPKECAALPTREELQVLVCGEDPEPRSTVQPEASSAIWPLSERAVESSVEWPIQPAIHGENRPNQIQRRGVVLVRLNG